MTNAIVQIQARLGSTRLPGKVLLPLGQRRVLEWVVTRCRKAKEPDDVVVAVGDRPENDAIVEWCTRSDVRCYRGPESDLVARHRSVAREVNADPIVRVTGDCPFVPPSEIDRLLVEHAERETQYTTNVTEEMPIGTAVDVIDRELLEDLYGDGEEHPTAALHGNRTEEDMRFSSSAPWSEHADAHVAVDTPVDYWGLTDALESTKGDPHSVIRWISQKDI